MPFVGYTWFFLRLWRFINHLLTYLLTCLQWHIVLDGGGYLISQENRRFVGKTSSQIAKPSVLCCKMVNTNELFCLYANYCAACFTGSSSSKMSVACVECRQSNVVVRGDWARGRCSHWSHCYLLSDPVQDPRIQQRPIVWRRGQRRQILQRPVLCICSDQPYAWHCQETCQQCFITEDCPTLHYQHLGQTVSI